MADLSEHSGSLSWEFSGFELHKFLSSRNGNEFVSETFSAGSFKFQCKIYPNGRKKEQKGCVMLYFILQTSLANKMNKITVNARLFCPQTLCDWRHIQHLKKDNAGIGWHSKNMLLSEIQNNSYLKFICEITIVRIEYKNNPNIYHKLSKMNIYTKHEWTINNKLFHSFKTAHNGKFYHSSDYNNGCWCSSIAPNGSNSKDINNVKCGLQLLQLPPFISKIKAKFTISSPFFNIKCQGKKEFSYNSTFIAWADGTLQTQALLNAIIANNSINSTSHKINFVVEIIIIKAYDEYDTEIPKTNWFKYGLINNLKSQQQPFDTTNADSIQTQTTQSMMTIDLASNYNLLSPSTTQMSVLSPINVHNSDGSDITRMTTKELKEADEEEDSLEYEDENDINITEQDEKQSLNTFNSLKVNHSSEKSKSYSKDISTNLQLINSQKTAITELAEKLEEIECFKTEDEKHLISMEKSMINLQKSQNRIQQQQFDQTSILKQYINELSLTMQRLTNEIVFIKNKVNKIEQQVENQQIQIFQNIQSKNSPKSNHRNSNSSNKSNRSSTSRRSDRKAAKKSAVSKKENKSKSRAEYKISSGLASWIKHECGFPQYIQAFAENGYDSFEIVKEMSKFELEDIGIHLKGHQFKIMREIEKLQNTQKHHRSIGGSNGIDNLKMINYLTPVASPAGSDSANDYNNINIIQKPITPTNDENTLQSAYSHSKLVFKNINSKTITATATNTNNTNTNNTNTGTEILEQKTSQERTLPHKHSSSYGHLKQTTPIHLTFGSNTLSPSHSQSMSMTSSMSMTTTNGYFAWNQNKKPMLLESPTNFSGHNNYNIGYNPKLYDSRSIKKGYHNHKLPTRAMPQISNMWECKSCHNSNLGTLGKCEFCQHQR